MEAGLNTKTFKVKVSEIGVVVSEKSFSDMDVDYETIRKLQSILHRIPPKDICNGCFKIRYEALWDEKLLGEFVGQDFAAYLWNYFIHNFDFETRERHYHLVYLQGDKSKGALYSTQEEFDMYYGKWRPFDDRIYRVKT